MQELLRRIGNKKTLDILQGFIIYSAIVLGHLYQPDAGICVQDCIGRSFGIASNVQAFSLAICYMP